MSSIYYNILFVWVVVSLAFRRKTFDYNIPLLRMLFDRLNLILANSQILIILPDDFPYALFVSLFLIQYRYVLTSFIFTYAHQCSFTEETTFTWKEVHLFHQIVNHACGKSSSFRFSFCLVPSVKEIILGKRKLNFFRYAFLAKWRLKESTVLFAENSGNRKTNA